MPPSAGTSVHRGKADKPLSDALSASVSAVFGAEAISASLVSPEAISTASAPSSQSVGTPNVLERALSETAEGSLTPVSQRPIERDD